MHFRKTETSRTDDFNIFAVMDIAKSLPEWFTTAGLKSLQKDIQHQQVLTAVDQEQVVGFITYFVNQGEATIGWMGVHPSHHRKGVGSKLLIELKKILAQNEIDTIYVSTLGNAVDYPPYEKTRAFYKKNRFVDHQKIQHPQNPEQEEELILKLKF